MIKRYYINNITQEWLKKRGTIVYIEKEYNISINNYLVKNLHHIQKACQTKGVHFLYIPNFYSSISPSIFKYLTGSEPSKYSHLKTHDILNALLSTLELNQIQGPSLLFTGASDNASCIAYAIGEDTSFLSKLFPSRKNKYIGHSIDFILSKVPKKHVPPIQQSLFDDNVSPSIQEPTSIKQEKTAFRKQHPAKLKDENKNNVADLLFEEDCHTRFRKIEQGDTNVSKISDEDENIEYCRISSRQLFDEDDDFESDACKNARYFILQLLQKGYSQEAIWALLAPVRELSPITITSDLRILLPTYDLEIELPPIQKALYLLFLKHPEGIYFKNMPDYKDELFHIYRKIAIRGEKQKHIATIMDLVDPLSNSINEKCSSIKKRITVLLDEELAKHYYISGRKSEIKKIDIDSQMITDNSLE